MRVYNSLVAVSAKALKVICLAILFPTLSFAQSGGVAVSVEPGDPSLPVCLVGTRESRIADNNACVTLIGQMTSAISSREQLATLYDMFNGQIPFSDGVSRNCAKIGSDGNPCFTPPTPCESSPLTPGRWDECISLVSQISQAIISDQPISGLMTSFTNAPSCTSCFQAEGICPNNPNMTPADYDFCLAKSVEIAAAVLAGANLETVEALLNSYDSRSCGTCFNLPQVCEEDPGFTLREEIECQALSNEIDSLIISGASLEEIAVKSSEFDSRGCSPCVTRNDPCQMSERLALCQARVDAKDEVGFNNLGCDQCGDFVTCSCDECEVPENPGCQYFKIEIERAAGNKATTFTTANGALSKFNMDKLPACAVSRLTEAANYAVTHANKVRTRDDFFVSRLFGNGGFARGKSSSTKPTPEEWDAMTERYINPYALKNDQPWNLVPTEVGGKGGQGWSVSQGYLMIDANCNSIPGSQARSLADSANTCGGGLFKWIATPISLVMEDGYDPDSKITISKFPMDPTVVGKSYTWKASKEAPLLVYDVEGKGKINSAYQLFGEWAFGGKEYASLEGNKRDVAPEKAERWKDGYEALGSLDTNNDGEVSGEELANLSLWFDENRNGVSEEGEVKRLSEVGITKLYYNVDRVDSLTSSKWSNIGYEREVNGKTVKGASVDWYADGAETELELINKQLGQAVLGGLVKGKELTPANETSKDVVGKQSAADLDGVWEWSPEGESASGIKGYLTFKSDESNKTKFSGHTLSGFSFGEGSQFKKTADALLSFASLEGETTWSKSENKMFVRFNVSDGSVETNGYLDGSGDLHGKSVAKARLADGKSSKEFEMSYSWVAKRVEGK